MHNYYTGFAVVAGIFVHCALISSDRSSSHYHLSHRINLFAETHMLCNVHAVVFTGNCVLSIHTYVCNVYTHTHSYTWCRVEGVCMRAPPGHRPSVYERIRLGRPPSLPLLCQVPEWVTSGGVGVIGDNPFWVHVLKHFLETEYYSRAICYWGWFQSGRPATAWMSHALSINWMFCIEKTHFLVIRGFHIKISTFVL